MIDSGETTPAKAPDAEPQPPPDSFPPQKISIFFFHDIQEQRSIDFEKMNEEYDVIVLGTGLTVR